LYYIPFQVPISLDGIDYFAYTVAINKESYFPTGYLITNFGWSTFLSPIFSIVGSNEMLELMNVQRIVSCFISVLTAIPIYFLCKTFFKKNIAILGAVLFLFEPRIIENSVLGITDPIFIFFVAITIMFTFIKDSRFFYLSFIFAGFAAFTRYEGLLLIIPILISFFIRRDFQKKSFLKIFVGVVLFFSIIILINMTVYEQTNSDIFSPLLGSTNSFSMHVLFEKQDLEDGYFGNDMENSIQIFTQNAITGYTKYLGWIMIPMLGLFIIPGLFISRKNPTKNKLIFLIFIIFLSISSLYAYGRGIQETRYLYSLIPIFVLFACNFFEYLTRKYDVKKIMIVTVSLVIVLSILFLEYDKVDYEYEREIYDVTVFVVKIADGVNNYNGGKFVRTASLENSWPDLLPINEKKKMDSKISKFSLLNFDNIDQFLKSNKNSGLTHLVINENDKEIFLNEIFHNEKDYKFLKKIYDSKELGFKNQIKIFEIDYDLFELQL
jgi:hypothetical protein